MELGDKLKELDLTVEEMGRLGNAFKKEKFRELFFDYAQELSDPENKRRYEEELKILEKDRGNAIEFIHPEPVKALRTCMNGSHKCFINICVSEKIGKPSCSPKVVQDGRKTLCWALPYILHPERQDIYRKGHRVGIYDVVFHPDTLDMASKNEKFMDMVKDTAIQGIQSAFSVSLDRNNVKEIRAKCKGTPQTCVLRKPIPGYQKPSGQPDPLEFPYPDQRRRRAEPPESAMPTKSCPQVRPVNSKAATKPSYTLKYRSYVDIQDFRCSRDCAQSPRPREIVVTIHVPLLKEVTAARVEARERMLLLESEDPAYRLELPLAYPVDEEKGEAKFNKQKGQLIVTLPVLPAHQARGGAAGPADLEDEQKARDIEELATAPKEGPEERMSEKEESETEEGPGEVKKVSDGRKGRREEEPCVEEEGLEEQRHRGVQCDADEGASGVENQPHRGAAEHSGCSENAGEAALSSTLESTSETRTWHAPGAMEREAAHPVREIQNLLNKM